VTKHLVCLMIGVLAVTGCRSSQKAGATSPVGALPPGSFARNWTAPLGLKSDPIREVNITPNRVFAYTNSNQSCVISRSSGHIEFMNNVDVSGGVLRAPIILGDYLIYPTSSSIEIYSQNGRPLKSLPLESPTSASGVGLGNMVYIGVNKLGGYGRLVALDITRHTGVPRWSVLTRGAITGRPAIYEKVIFAGSEDGNLVALTDDGGPAWPGLPGNVFSTNGSFMSDVTADETGVYASNTDTKLYVLDRVSGRIKWQYFSTAALKTPPAVTPTMVYQWVPGKGMAGIDKLNGTYNREPKWTVRDAVQFLSEDEAHAYLRHKDNTILAVDKATGKIQFTSKGRAFQVFATNTTDAIIYASTKDGIVVAIRPVIAAGETGEIVLNLQPIQPLALVN
jgi:outer membrane protein assembly factor BamB